MKTLWIEGVSMNYAGARAVPEKFSVTVNMPSEASEEDIEDKLLELFPLSVTFILDRVEIVK